MKYIHLITINGVVDYTNGVFSSYAAAQRVIDNYKNMDIQMGSGPDDISYGISVAQLVD